MENCARPLTGEELEETMMSTAGPPAITHGTSNFHTTLEEFISPSLDEIALGDCSGAGSSKEPKSEYFSARVEEMMRSKSQFSSVVEHEIEYSRVHWSEVSGPSDTSKVSGLSDSSEDNNDSEEVNREYYEEVDRENEEVFRELMNDPQWKHHERGDFFLKLPALPKLRKIAEGGQAKIFELIDSDDNVEPAFLLKVFKRGSRLLDLKKQWPCGILRREFLCIVVFGWLLDDGRFAFVMSKCWGDLRKLIDQAMQEKNNQGPPFPYEWSGVIWHAKHVMLRIAFHMKMLHEKGFIHRNLKAANILLMANDKGHSIFAADFECSIRVLGTGFWRAPEILLASLNGSAIDFSEKVDVYAYGMTCFEIATGRLPFEGELEPWRRADKILVIEGRRPQLPSDLDVSLKDLIERCWNPIPNERPNFSKIIEVLES